jgi:SPP1 family predicted phage head-tail adaptor
MRERVTLKSREATADAHGQKTIVWQTVGTVWAERLPVRASERFAAAQMQAEVLERFFIRYRTDVAETWRLEWDTGPSTPAYDIVGVTLMPDRKRVELLCRKAVKDGR